jgi:cytochrome P450
VGKVREEAHELVEQLPQWLFAFDAAAWASYRAMALVATHPAQAARAIAEMGSRDLDSPQDLPLLRPAMLESLRLWPTTPAVLRESTTPTTWQEGELPARTSILLYAPFFHRDDETSPAAHRFDPDLWIDNDHDGHLPLIPFSGGPGECPGRNFVLYLAPARIWQRCSNTTTSTSRIRPGSPLTPLSLRRSARFRCGSRCPTGVRNRRERPLERYRVGSMRLLRCSSEPMRSGTGESRPSAYAR